MSATRVPRDEPVITRSLARQQNLYVIAFAVLLAGLVGGYFYTVRVNDVQQLRQVQYTACQQRNNNVDQVRQSLLLLAEGEAPTTRAQLITAADALQKADCGLVLHS